MSSLRQLRLARAVSEPDQDTALSNLMPALVLTSLANLGQTLMSCTCWQKAQILTRTCLRAWVDMHFSWAELQCHRLPK